MVFYLNIYLWDVSFDPTAPQQAGFLGGQLISRNVAAQDVRTTEQYGWQQDVFAMAIGP